MHGKESGTPSAALCDANKYGFRAACHDSAWKATLGNLTPEEADYWRQVRDRKKQ
jgi:hypothetical protein